MAHLLRLTRGDDDGMGPHYARGRPHDQRPSGKINGFHVLCLEHRPPPLPLLAHVVHQVGPRDALGEPGEVFDLRANMRNDVA